MSTGTTRYLNKETRLMKHLYLLSILILLLSCSSPQPVEISDQNLAGAVREALGLAPSEPILQKNLDELQTLAASNAGITDL